MAYPCPNPGRQVVRNPLLEEMNGSPSANLDTIPGFTVLGSGILCFDPRTSKASIDDVGQNIDGPRYVCLTRQCRLNIVFSYTYSDAFNLQSHHPSWLEYVPGLFLCITSWGKELN